MGEFSEWTCKPPATTGGGSAAVDVAVARPGFHVQTGRGLGSSEVRPGFDVEFRVKLERTGTEVSSKGRSRKDRRVFHGSYPANCLEVVTSKSRSRDDCKPRPSKKRHPSHGTRNVAQLVVGAGGG